MFLFPIIWLTHEFSFYSWKTIINNLVSRDKTVFNSILNRISLSSVSTQQQPTGMVSMYASIDQVNTTITLLIPCINDNRKTLPSFV